MTDVVFEKFSSVGITTATALLLSADADTIATNSSIGVSNVTKFQIVI